MAGPVPVNHAAALQLRLASPTKGQRVTPLRRRRVDRRVKPGHDGKCRETGAYAALNFSAYCVRRSANHVGSTGRHQILSMEGPG